MASSGSPVLPTSTAPSARSVATAGQSSAGGSLRGGKVRLHTTLHTFVYATSKAIAVVKVAHVSCRKVVPARVS